MSHFLSLEIEVICLVLELLNLHVDNLADLIEDVRILAHLVVAVLVL